MGAKLLRPCQWRHKAGENKWEWKWREQNAYPTYQNSATITTPTLGSAPEQLTNQRIISGDIIITIILPIIITIIIIKAAVQKISDDRHLFTFLCKCDWPDFYILQIFFLIFFRSLLLIVWSPNSTLLHLLRAICLFRTQFINHPSVCLTYTGDLYDDHHDINNYVDSDNNRLDNLLRVKMLFLFKCK